jgi:hypothetical protein
MQTGTLVIVLLAAILALCLALYQYAYKSDHPRLLTAGLVFLRFLSWLAFFLLLINPQLRRENYSLELPTLVVLADNSSSLNASGASESLANAFRQLRQNGDIADRFKVVPYRFGSRLVRTDSLDFSDESTNLAGALASVNEIFSKSGTAIVALTDGIQTMGQDYEFGPKGLGLPVYPVILGDTTRYEDLHIEQVISNTYAFLNNQYPLETFVSYQGPSNISTTLTITVDGEKVQQETLQFSPREKSKRVNTLIPANSVGVKNIVVSISPLEEERNIANNRLQLAVEVIDEKTKVGLVYEIMHPDLGALKKAIESNEQRSVVFLPPDAPDSDLEDIDIFLLYQPDNSFSHIYDRIKNTGVGCFTIVGANANWEYLNKVQNLYEKEGMGPTEEIVPVLNRGFSLFDIGDFNVDEYPPLTGELGEILITRKHETLLGQMVRGVDLNEPLLVIIEGDTQKQAVLFGENVWKWRMQSYRNEGSFDNFDSLMGKILLYLGNKQRKRRFDVDYNAVYRGSREAIIRAKYFDETFRFDPNATLLLKVEGMGNNENREIPMLLKGTFYEADLSDLPAGKYQFTASVAGEDRKESGTFTILEFDVERQILATDYRKLERLGEKTGGKSYMPSEVYLLIEDLLQDDRFLPTQKSELIVVSLIEFKWLLALIAVALTAEWFIRKYNGLN